MARAARVFLCKDFVTYPPDRRARQRRLRHGRRRAAAAAGRRYDDGLLDAYGLADAKALLPKLL